MKIFSRENSGWRSLLGCVKYGGSVVVSIIILVVDLGALNWKSGSNYFDFIHLLVLVRTHHVYVMCHPKHQ